MVTLDRTAVHPVDIQTMEESTKACVHVFSLNVIKSKDVETGHVFELVRR